MEGTDAAHAILFQDPGGPIERFLWGAFVICGREHSDASEERVGAGKDIRLIGTDVSRWKERKGHRLKKSMITGVYAKGIEVLIIGTGVAGQVEVPEKVRKAIVRQGIVQLEVVRTPEACRIYNKLYRKGKSVALLAHGTC